MLHHFFHVELNILLKINELSDEEVIKLLPLLCNKKKLRKIEPIQYKRMLIKLFNQIN